MNRIWLFGMILATATAAVAAEADVYIFDALARGSYRAAYMKMIRKADVPDWVKDVVRTGDGVASPGTSIMIGGKTYRLDHVCKVHDCAGNTLTVLFAPGGNAAWGALIDKGSAPTLLGAPKADLAQALTNAAKP